MNLVVMSAGFGKRFGDRIKQLEPIGPNDETIMEMSVRKADKAGFDKIIFVIRKDIEELFKTEVLSKLSGTKAELTYVLQDMESDIKGTVCAVLSAKDVIDDDFVVINADDYYGDTAFEQLTAIDRRPPFLVGYELGNTLPKRGAVTRGVCQADLTGAVLEQIVETKNLARETTNLPTGTLVSMNMWCFPKKYLYYMQLGYSSRVKNGFKGEYLIPEFVQERLTAGDRVEIMPTANKWTGITYEADIADARKDMVKWTC